MQTMEIKKSDWSGYFKRLSKELSNKTTTVNIEQVGMDIGDQVIAEEIPLNNLAYDAKKDLLEISSAEADHRVNSPVGVYVCLSGGDVDSMEVIDASDHRQIIKFIHPLALSQQK